MTSVVSQAKKVDNRPTQEKTLIVRVLENEDVFKNLSKTFTF
jgi:hypothetical protein